MPDRPFSSASDFLAAERTFLAWIRTGLALMGFGFVVARFGLFLQTLQSSESSVALLLALVGLAMAIYLISVRAPGQPNTKQGERSMASISESGIATIPSRHSVEETVVKLQELLRAKAVKLFALVDHSGEAEKVGMQMRPTKLLIFGSPKAGTPLMIASPSLAIDLPLKILVWEDAARKTWVSYNSAQYLQTRHSLSEDLLQSIAVVEALAAKAAD